MNDLLGPLEGRCVFIIGLGEGVDGPPNNAGRCSAESPKSSSPKDTEPALHLVEPGGMGGRVVKVNVGVCGQPPVPFRLVGAQVVQHYVELCVRIMSDDTVHEIQELPPTTAMVVANTDEPCGHIQGRE